MEEPITRRFRRRLTLGHLMIAIAILAVWLALPTVLRVISIALSISYLSLIGARRMVLKRRRRVARWGFLVAATTINLYVAVCCIVPDSNSVAFSLIFPGLLLMGIPMIAALGTSWARLLADDESADSVQLRDAAGVAVFLIALLPMVTRLDALAAATGIPGLASRHGTSGQTGCRRHARQHATTRRRIPGGRLGRRAGRSTLRRPDYQPQGLLLHTDRLCEAPSRHKAQDRRPVPGIELRCLSGRRLVVPRFLRRRPGFVRNRFLGQSLLSSCRALVSAIHECRLRQFSKAIYRQIALSHVSTCGARACMTMML